MATPKRPLKLSKVSPKAKPVQLLFKQFVVKQSQIAGAGQGLFLMEKAKHGEKISRYSGKLLSREEAEASTSQYIVQVSKDTFLDGAGEDEWEGRFSNCARKAGKVPNAKLRATGQLEQSSISGRYWIPILAVGDIDTLETTGENFPDKTLFIRIKSLFIRIKTLFIRIKTLFIRIKKIIRIKNYPKILRIIYKVYIIWIKPIWTVILSG